MNIKYQINSPILILGYQEFGNERNKILIEFQNILDLKIIGVKFNICVIDIFDDKKSCVEVKVQKLDLLQGKKTYVDVFTEKTLFGEELNFEILQVVYEDGSWYSKEDLRYVDVSYLIEYNQNNDWLNKQELANSIEKYWSLIRYDNRFKFNQPLIKTKDIWICPCGQLNHNTVDCCVSCDTKLSAMNAFDDISDIDEKIDNIYYTKVKDIIDMFDFEFTFDEQSLDVNKCKAFLKTKKGELDEIKNKINKISEDQKEFILRSPNHKYIYIKMTSEEFTPEESLRLLIWLIGFAALIFAIVLYA